jgi:hypothetical protein
MEIYTWVTLGLLVAIYAFTNIHTSGIVEHDVPENIAALVFIEIFCLFASLVISFMAYAFVYQLKAEKVKTTRLRILAMLSTVLFGASAVLFKAIIAIAGFRRSFNSGNFLPLYALQMIFVIIGAVAWSLIFLPNSYYLALTRFTAIPKDWGTFCNLIKVVNKTALYSHSRPSQWPSFFGFVRNRDYYIYCAFISILDGKIMLTGQLATHRNTPDMHGSGEALSFSQILRQIDDSTDYWTAVDGYRKIGAML